MSNPALAAIFQIGSPNFSGVEVGEVGALSVSAVYRAVALIAGTVAQLPMRTLRDTGGGQRERVKSFLDDPGGVEGPTRFEWTETVLLHLLLHGNAYLLHVRGGAGQLLALVPVHPLCVATEQQQKFGDGRRVIGGKLHRATLVDGSTREFDMTEMTHIPALSTDGILGMSPIAVARNSLGTAIAGDRAAAKMFDSGALFGGFASLEGEEVDPGDATEIRKALDREVTGWENAGKVPFINRKIKFNSWSMSAEDAQFLQSRSFQVEEIARWFGVPPHLLMQMDKQTSWGTGVAESNRGMGRTVLAPWASRIEQRLSRLLPNPRFVEFDFSALERPTPETEIGLLNSQIDGGLITLNEARAVRNLPPVPGGDIIRIKGVPLAMTATPADPVDPKLEPEVTG